jgi:hypothetical protein
MRGLSVVGLLLLLAGCSVPSAGTPVAGEAPTATAPTTTTTTTAERVGGIDLAGVQVCPLLGSLPLTSYGVDPARTVGGESSIFPGSRDCFANGGSNLGLTLVAVVDQGATEYLDGARAEVTETDTNGFPVHVIRTTEPSSCFGAIDVADQQMIFINYGVVAPDQQPVTTQDTLCARVVEIAGATITQLAR